MAGRHTRAIKSSGRSGCQKGRGATPPLHLRQFDGGYYELSSRIAATFANWKLIHLLPVIEISSSLKREYRYVEISV
jgi:hypothetical protein